MTRDAYEQRRDRLRALLSIHADEQLSTEEQRELTNLLQDSAALREEYFRFTTLQALLHIEAQRKTDGGGHLSPLSTPTRSVGEVSASRAPHSLFPKLLRSTADVLLHPIALVLLVGLVAAGWVAYASWHQAPAPPQPVAQAPPLASQPVLLAHTERAQWLEGFEPAEKGPLRTGQRLRLVRGTAELKFPGNATVVVEAPAEFKIVDGDTCWLDSGKLTAQVPHEARGFEVLTPAVRAVDLGTRFVLEVDQEGVGLEVVEGRVRMEPRSTTATPSSASFETLLLHGGEAARLDANSERLTRVVSSSSVADYQELVLSFRPRVYLSMEPAPKNDRVLTNLAAVDRPGTLSFAGPNSPFVRGRVGQALRIRGEASGDKAIVPTGSMNVLTLAAWVYFDAATARDVPIAWLAWDEWRGGAALRITGSGELYGGGWVMIQKLRKRHVEVRESGTSFPRGTWQHVAFVVDGQTFVLYRNGRIVATHREGPHALYEGTFGRGELRVGGDPIRIDEVALFDRALSLAEVSSLYEGSTVGRMEK